MNVFTNVTCPRIVNEIASKTCVSGFRRVIDNFRTLVMNLRNIFLYCSLQNTYAPQVYIHAVCLRLTICSYRADTVFIFHSV